MVDDERVSDIASLHSSDGNADCSYFNTILTFDLLLLTREALDRVKAGRGGRENIWSDSSEKKSNMSNTGDNPKHNAKLEL